MIRVLVVDDQALVRAGFRMILEAEEDLVVAGEAADGHDALRQVEACSPDVVLMDVRMPSMDGIEATRRILQEHTSVRVIMLTTFDMDQYVYGALRAGASGFLLKDVLPELLVDGIRAVVSGESLLSPSVTRRLIEVYVDRAVPAPAVTTPTLPTLTPREHEILVLLARGLSNGEIAAQLVISETTVKTHVTRVLMKLDLRDRVQAAIYAYEHGVVHVGTSTQPGQ